MILLLDIGNSRIKWALKGDNGFAANGTIAHGDEAVATLIAQVERCERKPVRVVASNVKGAPFAAQLNEYVKAHWGFAVEYVETRQRGFGVINGYATPAQLGVDRWLALVAGYDAAVGPLCIIDCGTALTVDLLESGGTHLGGMIVPGVKLMQDVLVGSAAQLELSTLWQPGDTPLFAARSTEDAIMGGVRYALAAVIERVIIDAKARLGDEMEVVLSGGGADELGAFITADYRYEPALVLQGVAIVAEAGR